MTKHNKRRVAVVEDGEFVGVLEDIDLLSFLAGNAQLVAGRIDRASSVADLASAAQEIEPQIRTLRRQGVKIEVVCEIVSDLNRRLHAKLFSLDRATIHPRAGLSHRHGQRGARRADVPHRPGQRAHPVRTRPGGGSREIPRRTCSTRLETMRLSALPRRSDGAQPGVVEDACGISRRFSPLAGAVG